MTRAARYAKASTLQDAISLRRADPSACYLAGGTFVLAGDEAAGPESVIDVGSALPRSIERGMGFIAIGAGATLQEIAEGSPPPDSASRGAGTMVPPCLAEAALTMMNRNTRNRATIGGNIGADKSCSSLIPILLVLDAEVEAVSPESPEAERLALRQWLQERDSGGRKADLILRILVPVKEGTRAAYRRWNRVSCDLSVLGAAAAYETKDGRLSSVRIALGGLGPKSRRSAEIEALFEGRALPSRDEIEKAAARLLRPLGDLRAGEGFKRLRGSQLIADAILEALPLAGGSPSKEPRP